mgnify:CR=1 FL=1
MGITLYEALIGSIIPLAGFIIFHRLAKSRDKETRHTEACKNFRNEVINSTSSVPDENSHWDNDVLARMPELVNNIGNAIEVYKYFLSRSDKQRLEKIWYEFKDLIENNIPKSHSREEILYGGGQMTARESKVSFKVLRSQLIELAKET